jgi:ribosomal protein S18 acetylase RimI-like enzyme
MFLEDIFVQPQFRKKGIGTALLASVAHIAVKENCYALRWEVLHWNQPAISLYESLGATFPDHWRAAVITHDALLRLAEKAP